MFAEFFVWQDSVPICTVVLNCFGLGVYNNAVVSYFGFYMGACLLLYGDFFVFDALCSLEPFRS